jgi:glycosyltransferase involved in cell wall biosynthesis
LEGARRAGFKILTCHRDPWRGVTDRSQLSLAGKIRRVLAEVACFPRLIACYLRMPPHRLVLIPYLGQLGVLILWPWARLRGARVVLDAFISLYDTVVVDRQLISRWSPIAWALYLLEWLALRTADVVFLDTAAHAGYFERTFHLPAGSVKRVWVGAEDLFAPALPDEARADDGAATFRVLFYGQLIPLHGIGVILKAAALLAAEDAQRPATDDVPRVVVRVIGRGQESDRVAELLQRMPPDHVEHIPWIPYDRLPAELQAADLCLGIFGAGGKASRVIPNKVFQIVAARRPLITADTPAIREWLTESEYLRLIPAGDSKALAESIDTLRRLARDPARIRQDLATHSVIGPTTVGNQLAQLLSTENPRS